MAFNRAVIVTGGNVGGWIVPLLKQSDYLIGADRGALFLVKHSRPPHLALGDFDSVSSDELNLIQQQAGELHQVDSIDKDWSDTELALREAIKRNYQNIVIMGGLGTRFDHSLANVHLLVQANEQQSNVKLVDEHNEIQLCTSELNIDADSSYPYVSLLPLSPEVTGVTLEGFRYPLHQATLKLGWSLGVSNVLVEPYGSIHIQSGQLLVIRSRD
ncbi:MAG: thiamine diphosphokinase [Candidatus Cohnella colombiensis]|uniref:Thiamine diphosphokinase n=1 Tax=Candidatus Cohnella colombiensis TaxID=3121368 RepID=A0AA95EZC4_9BACL|nr:MAG: thiamine diphosphokinase [Cohnella sp.]